MIDPAQALSGFVVGAIVGLTGVGGGSLMTPLLVLLFGIHPATAVGTDLLHAAITKAGGTYVHAKGPGRLADHGPLGFRKSACRSRDPFELALLYEWASWEWSSPCPRWAQAPSE